MLRSLSRLIGHLCIADIQLCLYTSIFLSILPNSYLWKSAHCCICDTTQVRHTQHVGFMLYLLSSSLSNFLQLFLIEAFMLYPTNWHNSFIWSIASYISLFIDFLVPMALINMKTAKWYLISLLCYILYFKILFWPIKFPFYSLLAGYFSLFFLVLFFPCLLAGYFSVFFWKFNSESVSNLYVLGCLCFFPMNTLLFLLLELHVTILSFFTVRIILEQCLLYQSTIKVATARSQGA